MLPNEVFALACRAYYDEIGLIVDKTNGEFAHCPYPAGMGETGYYLLHEHHQHQGILQSKDVGRLCFWVGDAKKWLLNCDPFPEDYFVLWDIYEEFVKKHSLANGQSSAKKWHEAKDENGKSLHALKMLDKLHREKDEKGRSVHGVRSAERLNLERDEKGRSVRGVKNAERLHAEKDEKGRSVNAMKGVNKQHAKKDEDGKSIHALRMSSQAHAERDDKGRSVLGMKNIKRLHAKKDERGKSVNAVKGARKSAEKLHSTKDENGKSVIALGVATQVWESTIDGFRSNAGNVARHNRVNGWDPNARFRVK